MKIMVLPLPWGIESSCCTNKSLRNAECVGISGIAESPLDVGVPKSISNITNSEIISEEGIQNLMNTSSLETTADFFFFFMDGY